MYLLVIGGKSDIGFSIAKKFYQNNYNIYLTKKHDSSFNKKIFDLKDYEKRIRFLDFNLLDFENHQKFYNSLNPKPKIVVCAAGFFHDNTNLIENFTEIKKTIDTNYTAYVSLLNIISDDFKKRNSGSIIGISSVAGDRGRSSNYIYGSSKSAFSSYLSGLRNSMYKYNVNVITVKPGFVKSKMTKNLNFYNILTSTPEIVAKDVFKAWKKKKCVVYTPWYWKYISIIIRLIPEKIFQKLNL